MKTITLTQAQKQHDTNQLHDAFIAAHLVPQKVESTATESSFAFADDVSDTAIKAVIDNYALLQPAATGDISAAWQTYKTAVNNATTVAQLKSVLTTELGVLLTEILRPREGILSTFDPSALPSLKAWYVASSIAQPDNTPVAAWPDSSGNGWNLAQTKGANQPTCQTNELNGQPVVRFDGSDFLTIGNTFKLNSQAATIFVVKKPVNAAAQNVFLSAGLAGSSSTAILSYQQFQSTSTLSTHNVLLEPVSPFGHQNFQRWSYNVLRCSSSRVNFRINGYQSVDLSPVSAGTAEGLNFGAHFDGLATPSVMFNGDIAEVVICNAVLTDSEVLQVEQYLATKYGVAPNLVVMDGDSLTRGSGASANLSDNYPSQLAGLLSQSYDLISLGVGAQTTADMISDAVTQVDPLLTWRPRKTGVLVFWNTNDLHFGTSVATTQSRIMNYCSARRAAGWKVIVGTILPRSVVGTPANYAADRLTINTWIRANWASFCDGFFDPAADSRIGDAGDEANTTFYNDRAHLNGTGYAIVAALVRDKIVQLTT